MKQVKMLAVLLFLSILFTGPILAQDPIVYPAQGQSQEQMEQDEFQCMRWARDQTGFDPMQTPTATSPPPSREAPRGGAGRGAIAGAAGGAIIGGIAGGRSGAGRGGNLGGGCFEPNYFPEPLGHMLAGLGRVVGDEQQLQVGVTKSVQSLFGPGDRKATAQHDAIDVADDRIQAHEPGARNHETTRVSSPNLLTVAASKAKVNSTLRTLTRSLFPWNIASDSPNSTASSNSPTP